MTHLQNGMWTEWEACEALVELLRNEDSESAAYILQQFLAARDGGETPHMAYVQAKLRQESLV